MNKLMAELNFSLTEVDEFRMVFMSREEEASADMDFPRSGAGLPRDYVRRVVRDLGMSLKGDERAKLDNKLNSFGCTEERPLDFVGFLRLMRWVLDRQPTSGSELPDSRRG